MTQLSILSAAVFLTGGLVERCAASEADRSFLVDPLIALKHSSDHSSICEREDWRKKALKLVKESPAAGVFFDLQGRDKFEASSITHYNGEYVIVFDNLDELGFVDHHLDVFGEQNYLAPLSEAQLSEARLRGAGDSEYEAITHRTRTDTLLAVKEAAHEQETGHWHAIVYEIEVNDDREQVILGSCKLDYDLPDGDKKGLEGAEYVDRGGDGEFLLGVCEGNFCEGKQGRGKEAGNGRVIVAKLEGNSSDGDCLWKTQKVIHIPEAAHFHDFSDMDVHHQGGSDVARIAITSQEDAALWIGEIDLGKMEFVGDGEVVHFPRTEAECLERYCNVEGVQFIDNDRVMTVTDRAKADQPWSCSAHDQSIQIFALPHNKHLG